MTKLSITNQPKSDLIRQLTTYQAGVLEATVHRNLQKYCENILKDYELTKMHWMLIGTVLDHSPEGMRLTDLAKKLGTTISYITVSVNLLSSRGIITRVDSVKDSRSVLISITPSYQATCHEIEQRLRKYLRELVYSHIDPKDLETYAKVVAQLSDVTP